MITMIAEIFAANHQYDLALEALTTPIANNGMERTPDTRLLRIRTWLSGNLLDINVSAINKITATRKDAKKYWPNVNLVFVII